MAMTGLPSAPKDKLTCDGNVRTSHSHKHSDSINHPSLTHTLRKRHAIAQKDSWGGKKKKFNKMLNINTRHQFPLIVDTTFICWKCVNVHRAAGNSVLSFTKPPTKRLKKHPKPYKQNRLCTAFTRAPIQSASNLIQDL